MSSEIHIWWNNPDFQSQLSCVFLTCSLSVFHVALEWPWLYLMACGFPFSSWSGFQTERFRSGAMSGSWSSGLSHTSFKKTDLSESSLSEEPSDHHRSYTKFHGGFDSSDCGLLASPDLCLTIRGPGVVQSWKLNSSENIRIRHICLCDGRLTQATHKVILGNVDFHKKSNF